MLQNTLALEFSFICMKMASRRADVFFVALVFALVFASFRVKKAVSSTYDGSEIVTCKNGKHFARESFVFSSLYHSLYTGKLYAKPCNKTLLLLLLLTCGDIETCPGPQSMEDLMQTNGLKIIHQNCRGLFHNMANLTTLFSGETNIIITLSETHIESHSEYDNNNLYTIPGFRFIKKNRNIGKGGGVAMFIPEHIKWNRRTDLEHTNIECIWIEICPEKAKHFLVGCIYRPPDSSSYLPKNWKNLFSDMLITVNNLEKEIILLGDININYLKKAEHREIKDIITAQGMKQIVKDPTRVTVDSKTLIDVILTNKQSSISKTTVIPLSLSDHDCIACVRKINHTKTASREITSRNYRTYDCDAFTNELKSHDWTPIYSSNNVNKAWNLFKNILLNTINIHAPIVKKRIKGKRCPWLTADIRTQMSNRDKILRKARKTKKDSDWLIYKQLKNRCNNMVKHAKRKYHNNLLSENSRNPAKFWKTIKEIFPTNESCSSSFSSSNNSQKLSKANAFCSFFSTVAYTVKKAAQPLKDFVWGNPKQPDRENKTVFVFNYVTKIFVEKQLKNLKKRKAAGVDQIPPGMLKDAASVLAGPLSFLINLSLRTSTVPSDWKISKVIPLHKGGTKDMTNYRPISILPVISKILERAAHDQLTKYLEENHILSKSQFGYRKKHSTELATLLLTDDISREIDRGNLVGAVFIDLSKAFDTLSHSVLISKMRSYGIRGAALQWFTDYLFNRSLMCDVDGQISEPRPLTCGVPQGSILGPILFLIYFNDFDACLSHSKVIKFADDTVIYVSRKSKVEIEKDLNTDLQKILDYFTKNELVINLKPGKTESIMFGTRKKLNQDNQSINLQYNSQPISTTKEYKYLGTILDQTLSFNTNFNRVYKRTSGKLRLLWSLKLYLSPESLIKIYKGILLPVLLYSCTTNLNLTNSQMSKLSSLDNRIAQITTKKQSSIENEIKKHSVILVKKCLNGEVCENFETFFTIRNHKVNTRNNGLMLQVPKVRLQLAKFGFRSMGVKFYNELPIEHRQAESSTTFRKLVTDYFKV